MTRNPKKLLMIILLFVFPGFIWIWFGLPAVGNTQQLIEIYQSKSWNAQKAQIIGRKIENFRGRGFQQNFRVNLRYRYLVNSQVFEKDIGSLEKYTSSVQSYVQNYFSKYKLGSNINIKFNPKTPNQSCFRCEVSGLEVAFNVFQWLVMFAGIRMTFLVFRFVKRGPF
jgi:Protein of unknown function (DUF3592)